MNDTLIVAAVLLQIPGSKLTIKRVSRRLPWDKERIEAALGALIAQNLIVGDDSGYVMDSDGLNGLFDAEKGITPESVLSMLNETVPEEPPSEVVEQQEGIVEDSVDEDATPAAAAPVEPRKKLKMQPIETPKKSRLEMLLSKIDEITPEEVYDGDTREQKLNDAFQKLTDTVAAVNEGILSLARRSSIVTRYQIIALKRVIPEGNGLGGVVMSYSPYKGKIVTLLKRIWPEALTDRWLEKFNRDAEHAAVGLLEGLTNRVLKKARGSHSTRNDS